jgi:hypothetical protein
MIPHWKDACWTDVPLAEIRVSHCGGSRRRHRLMHWFSEQVSIKLSKSTQENFSKNHSYREQ